jgi:hypothetical protein
MAEVRQYKSFASIIYGGITYANLDKGGVPKRLVQKKAGLHAVNINGFMSGLFVDRERMQFVGKT